MVRRKPRSPRSYRFPAGLWRDLTALDNLFVTENSTEIKELKRRVGRALLESADNVLTGDLTPDRANAWRAIMSDFSELFGLNAPKRSESVSVSIEADPQKLGPYQWFCFISRDLSLRRSKVLSRTRATGFAPGRNPSPCRNRRKTLCYGTRSQRSYPSERHESKACLSTRLEKSTP